MYNLIKAVEEKCKRALDAIKARVSLTGAISVDDYNELRLVPQVKRQVIPSKEVMEYLTTQSDGELQLRPALTEEEVLSCGRLAISELKKALSAKTPRGLKTKVIDAAMERLDQMGAISVTGYERLEIVKKLRTP